MEILWDALGAGIFPYMFELGANTDLGGLSLYLFFTSFMPPVLADDQDAISFEGILFA